MSGSGALPAEGLAHVVGSTSTPLLHQTIGQSLDQTVARCGESDALVVPFQDVRLTYREFNAEVERVARALLALGLRKGERIGMWSPNCAEWVYVQYATARAGVILVNINPAYRTEELRYVLAQSGCRALIAAISFKTSDYQAMVAEVRVELPDLEHLLFLGTPGWDAFLASASGVSRAALSAREATLDPDDPINIQYTSGTTGFPKGATLSHRNILNNGFFCGEAFRYTERDRVCIPVPFYHCFGMVIGNLACTTHGAAIVLPAPAFEPGATLDAIEAERCTCVLGVPTMFIAMLGHPDFAARDLSSLRTGMMAGSPCPVEVMKQVIGAMHAGEMTSGYGLTETSPVSTQTAHDDPLDKRVGSVGRVHPHVQVKVIDPASGATLARDVAGELCTKGYSVMLGYWNEPEKTAQAIDADGWMHTGDLATIDGEGYVNIVGRIKDMIIRGGENVYPREVEEFLFGNPDIADVQVIGVPDPRYGEELMAWVKMRPGADPLTAETLRAYCAGRIAHYKIPRYVHITDDFPMTVTGKVQKFRMREIAIEQLGLQAAAAAKTA